MSYLLSPLKYFGNREQQEDFFALIKAHIIQKRQGKKFSCCYDLFAGSASISLQALEYDVAAEYIINDFYPPLAIFWQAVYQYPDQVIVHYQSFLEKYLAAPQLFYNKLQFGFNKLELPQHDPAEIAAYAAQFAFIINHAKNGMPLLSGQDKKQYLQCEWIDTAEQLDIDINFAQLVQKTHKLFQGKKIIFSSISFENYISKVTSDDLVLLDPPYPDMPDAVEQPDKHIYQRNQPKSELQQSLNTSIIFLDEINAVFVMFYGVLGMKNQHPIYWPKGHILRLSGDSQGPFNEYIEHVYLAKELASVLTHPDDQGKYPYQDKLQPCFFKIFQTQAIHNANKVALVWKDKKYTYEQINKAANRLANYLLYQGLDKSLEQNPESLVTIYLDRSPQLIISLLAIMKVGAAYLPLDANSKRLKVAAAYERIQQSGSKFILTHKDHAQQLKQIVTTHNEKIDWQAASTIIFDHSDLLCENFTEVFKNDSDIENNLNRKVSTESLAYVMYTSGSMGKPKGVEILQRGLPYAFGSHQDLLNLGPNDRVAQFSSIGFDASLMEIMLALGSGAELHLVDENNYSDAAQLTHLLQSHNVTVAIQTPKMLETLNPNAFPHLRGLLIVGDTFPKTLSDQWQVDISIENATQRRSVINGYGLTETTICTTLELCGKEKTLTVGLPILGCEVYLRSLTEEESSIDDTFSSLNNSKSWLQPKDQKKITPTDFIEEGALYISGPCLARGYWKNPEQTKQRFRTIMLDDHKKILYQSGDVGFFARKSGEISLKGRIDRQIKIHGQRMELGELEEQINVVAKTIVKLKDVRALLQKQELQLDKIKNSTFKKTVLTAYLVPYESELVIENPAKPSNKSLDILLRIREQLLTKLPAYMCPALVNFLFVDTLIYKDNDKKSYNDLAMQQKWPAPCLVLNEGFSEFIKQLSVDEEKDYITLSLCIAKSLGVQPHELNLQLDYYAQGGDSISVKWLFEALRKQTFNSKELKEVVESLTVEMFNRDSSVLGIWKLLRLQMNKKLEQQATTHQILADDAIPLSTKVILRETGFLRIDEHFKHQFKIVFPVYAIHSMLGDADLDYSGSQLDQLPCYYTRLNAPQLTSWSNLDDLVNQHVASIGVSHSQREPYWLIGWSSGGLIARLIAQKLRSQGGRVFTLLLDSHHPKLMQLLDAEKHAEFLLSVMSKLIEGLSSVWQLNINNISRIHILNVLQKIDSKELQVKEAFKVLRIEINFFKNHLNNLEPGLLTRGLKLINCSEQLILAELSYKNYVNDLTEDDTLIIASQSNEQWGEHLGWQIAVNGKTAAQILYVDTDHFELVNNQQIMQYLELWLTKPLLFLKSSFVDALENYNKNEFSEAIEKLTHVIRINPNDKLAYQNRANVKAALEQFQEAIEDYNKVTDIDNKYIAAYNSRAYMQYKLGKYFESIQAIEQVINLDKKSENAYYLRGLNKYKLGKLAEAIKDYEHAISLNHNNADIFFHRAQAKFDQGQYQEAMIDYDRCANLAPSHTYALFNRGVLKQKLGLNNEAIADYTQVINLDSEDWQAYVNRGVIRVRKKEYQLAKYDFFKALEIKPMVAVIYYNLGIARLDLGEFEAAINDFNKAIELDPNYLDAYFKRGLANLSLRNYTAAIEDYNQGLFLNDQIAKAYLNRGYAKSKLKRHLEAAVDFEQAVKLNPKDVFALINLGNSKRDLHQYQAAIEIYDQALTFGFNSLILIERGYAKFCLKQYPEAINDLESAISLDEKNPQAFDYLAQVKYTLGRYTEALHDMDQAIALGFKDSNYLYFRDKLSQRFAVTIYQKDFDLLPSYENAVVIKCDSGKANIISLDNNTTAYIKNFSKHDQLYIGTQQSMTATCQDIVTQQGKLASLIHTENTWVILENVQCQQLAVPTISSILTEIFFNSVQYGLKNCVILSTFHGFAEGLELSKDKTIKLSNEISLQLTIASGSYVAIGAWYVTQAVNHYLPLSNLIKRALNIAIPTTGIIAETLITENSSWTFTLAQTMVASTTIVSASIPVSYVTEKASKFLGTMTKNLLKNVYSFWSCSKKADEQSLKMASNQNKSAPNFLSKTH